MKNTKPKLIEVLLTVDQKEWKSIKRFLLLHTTEHSEYYRLLTTISNLKNLNDFDSEAFREKHFQEIKPKNFLNMMSRVLEWVEDWLVYRLLDKNKDQKKLYIIKAYNDRGLYKHADTHAEKIEHKLKNQKGLDAETNKHLQQLMHIQYYSNNPIKYKIGYEMLTDLIQYQRRSYKEYALTYMLELNNRSELSGFDFEKLQTETNETISHIEESPASEALKIALQLFKKTNTESVHSLYNILVSRKIENNTEFHLLLYSYLWRYARIKWSEGLIEDKSLLMKLIEYGITSGVYSINGKVQVYQFNNLVTRLCQFQNRKDVNTFIDTWIDKVNTDDKKSCSNHAKAITSFYSEDYISLLENLKHVKYKHLITKLTGYSLTIIALYSTEESSLLQDHIYNFKRLLKRNIKKINSVAYQRHQNLLKVIELLLKRKYNKSIVINLDDYKPLFYKSWFLKQGIE